jgi:very-short-patch-repair endonuclease
MLWGLARRWVSPLEVTALTRRRPSCVRVHRSRSLEPQHVTVHLGVPVTTVARTLLDVVDRLDDKALARAVNDARLARHLRQWELAALVEQFPGRSGAARLRKYFATLEAPTRSDLEDAFLAFLDRHRLPRPEINFDVAGHEVDAFFREHRLAVELDGYDTHGERSAFEADRDRDADLLAVGIPTVRITHERIVRAPRKEAERLQAILAARGEESGGGGIRTLERG